MKIRSQYNSKHQCNQVFVVNPGIDLGNNYSIEQFIQNFLDNASDKLLAVLWLQDLDDIVTISVKRKFGAITYTHKETLSMHDIADFL